jgi:hypothetical protein
MERYQCCFCKKAATTGDGHRLNPVALTLVTNCDGPRDDQREQTFFCHFECFQRIYGDEGSLYIADPDFSTVGEFASEETTDA